MGYFLGYFGGRGGFRESGDFRESCGYFMGIFRGTKRGKVDFRGKRDFRELFKGTLQGPLGKGLFLVRERCFHACLSHVFHFIYYFIYYTSILLLIFVGLILYDYQEKSFAHST